MSVCLICGKENESIICSECLSRANLPWLCRQIIDYVPGSNINLMWEREIEKLEKAYYFRNYAFEVASLMESPHKEYWQIEAKTGNRASISKADREWLYETAPKCIKTKGLTVEEKIRVAALVMEASYNDYKWAEAEEWASLLSTHEVKNKYVYYALGVFYLRTRRYEIALEFLEEGKKVYEGDPYIQNYVKEIEDCQKRLEGEKPNYQPKPSIPKEEKQIVIDGYLAFLTSIGVEDLSYKKPKLHKKEKAIPQDLYPDAKEVKTVPGNTFVAFDVETTGKNTRFSSPTEIAAIRVVNGEIVESKEFMFQELVHPIDQRIPEEVERVNGITNEMVKEARSVKEVFNDFADFIGDDILLGYNCMRFDSKILKRAGRYAFRIIENPYYDVLFPAQEYSNAEGLPDSKLSTVSTSLGIVNPQAHRALADAITTAKVYLKLYEKGYMETKTSAENLLDDIDNW